MTRVSGPLRLELETDCYRITGTDYYRVENGLPAWFDPGFADQRVTFAAFDSGRHFAIEALLPNTQPQSLNISR